VIPVVPAHIGVDVEFTAAVRPWAAKSFTSSSINNRKDKSNMQKQRTSGACVCVDMYSEAAGPVEPLLTCKTYMFFAGGGELAVARIIGIVDADGRSMAACIHQQHVIH